MKANLGLRVGFMTLLLLVASATVSSAESWSFSDVTRIDLQGVSGDVIVRPASGGQGVVQLEANVSPRGNFEPKVDQDGDTLRIEEKWSGRSSSGKVEWTIFLPQGSGAPSIEIETASGNLDGKDVTAKIMLETASGDINLSNVDLERDSKLSTASGDYSLRTMRVMDGTQFSTASGDFNLEDVELEDGVALSTASGDIECDGCRGHMEFSTASGNVEVRASRIEGSSDFSSASGDVALYLDEIPSDDLSASSASGDVLLKADDFGGSYTLVLVKREDKGQIVSPFAFTSERTFKKHHTYEEKTVERGSGGPKIELSTASGSVVVKE